MTISSENRMDIEIFVRALSMISFVSAPYFSFMVEILIARFGAVHRTEGSDSLRGVDAGESRRAAIAAQYWMRLPCLSRHNGLIWQ